MLNVHRPISVLALALLLPACDVAPDAVSDLRATGTQTLALSEDGGSLFAVNADVDVISRVSVADGSVIEATLAGEPTRIARAGDKLVVTLRTARSIAVLDGDLNLERTIAVGAEPFGVLTSLDGDTAWVSLSMEDRVVAVDLPTGEVVASWDVANEPRWLARAPEGTTLYVAPTRGGTLTAIDLTTGESSTFDLPTMGSFNLATGADIDLTPRITGDIAVSPDGDELGVPTLYVDNLSPASEPDPEEATVGGYASSASVAGVARFNPSVVRIPLGDGGAPLAGDAEAEFLAGTARVPPATATVRSYPTSVTYSPDGELILATMEGSRVVVLLSTDPEAASGFDSGFGFDEMGREFGFSDFNPGTRAFITTDNGPRGVTFVDGDNAWVHSFLDRSVSPFDVTDFAARVDWGGGIFSATTNDVLPFGTSLTTRKLAPEVETGRMRFYSSVDPDMVAPGAGVSCATCHFDGRNDGLTWTFEGGVRQTPTLAGEVSRTAPFTWTDEVTSISDEVMRTSQGRMGGEDLELHDADLVAAFVDSTRMPDVPFRGSDREDVARGRIVFSDVGCASCHPSPLYTDNVGHTMLGLRSVNTPTLVGVAASAPYFHDGSAMNLREVVEAAARGEMGSPFEISAEDTEALVAFLKSI